MNKLQNFDVLIVYNSATAKSASTDSLFPFNSDTPDNIYNGVYGHFLEVCRKRGLKAAFSTSSDVLGPGLCKSFWSYRDNKWSKSFSPCYSNQIFDKVSPGRQKSRASRQLLFSSPLIRPFISPSLYQIFFDKQKTHDHFIEHSLPTLTIEGDTLANLKSSCSHLSSLVDSHPHKSDFSTDIILKDRFGAGGRRIYKFRSHQYSQMLSVLQKNTKVSYIIQPFLNFDKGFTYEDSASTTDIRFIFLGNKILQTYIRVAQKGNYLCNEHKGGLLTYISIKDIPLKLVKKANSIAKSINSPNSLYSLDFIISNNGNSFLLEGNSGPGLDWDITRQKNETHGKQLIDHIVMELRQRIQSDPTSPLS